MTRERARQATNSVSLEGLRVRCVGVSLVRSGMRLLSSFDCGGIVRLHFAFQDDFSLYFVLELAAGGELASQISRMGTCLLPEYMQMMAVLL